VICKFIELEEDKNDRSNFFFQWYCSKLVKVENNICQLISAIKEISKQDSQMVRYLKELKEYMDPLPKT
jgi:ferritin